MKGVLKLGSVSGIKIEVHWTFTLLLIWVVISEILRGGTLLSTLFSIGLILILFVCVVLHELGHALTAKKFHIKTQNITLLPIGGMATMEKIPEKPWQELAVALAGPAVNVVIALLLYLFIPVKDYLGMEPGQILESLNTLNSQTFFFYLFAANVMLVVFNMIPAFPMDGGRVFRALLSFAMDRVKATSIASGLGQLMAVLFFFLGVFSNPFLILIAIFIFISAYGENQMVQQHSLLKGHTAKEATLKYITRLHPEDTAQKAIDTLLAGSEKDFVVTDDNRIVGVLYQKDIIKNTTTPSVLIGDIMQTTFKTVDMSTEMVKVLELIKKDEQNFFPVTKDQQLVGAIDSSNISEFILLKNEIANKPY
ncbi:site-2 protease family protein [Croceitalea sp. MTPC9]|uniref:site-2 protease family protein n=1 Tax=unclassified Croceitalea TaxID=2632280 RepID=UPI002B391F01|nr:site-2 protease family protein [Croceitalea sp. MTPC6]GMN17980.1 site-2 protease family protein [Croceitalea sp. MTPC9]